MLRRRGIAREREPNTTGNDCDGAVQYTDGRRVKATNVASTELRRANPDTAAVLRHPNGKEAVLDGVTSVVQLLPQYTQISGWCSP